MRAALHRHSSPIRHPGESWDLIAFEACGKKNGIPAFAGMTEVGDAEATIGVAGQAVAG
jgi:hypothetical protein